jgi:hypothetical protein
MPAGLKSAREVDGMSGTLTRNHLKKLVSSFDVFVETGTYLGYTTAIAARLFKKVYTIELSREIFEQTRAKFPPNCNIEFVQGDSAVELKMLAERIDRPCVFFLDSHFAGGKTAFGEVEVPLSDELTSVSKRKFADLVIVDDYRLFGQRGTTGTEGSELYPPSDYDWTDISLDRCLDVIKQNGRTFIQTIYDDRVYILLSGEGPLKIRSEAELQTLATATPSPLHRFRPAVIEIMRMTGVHGLAKRIYENHMRYRLGV